MRLVIRFGKGHKVSGRRRPQNPTAALALGSILTLAAVAAGALGLWRIAADLGLTSDFAIPSGLFSHWQVWIAVAVLLEVCARLLQRTGRRQAPGEPESEERARGRAV